MGLLGPDCNTLFKNLVDKTSSVLLLKNLNFEITIATLLFIELMFSQYQIQKPLIHHHHAIARIIAHQIKFLRIFEDKEKQLLAIQRILLLKYAQISILPVLIQ